MDGFASKVRYSLAFVGGSVLAANAYAASTIDENALDGGAFTVEGETKQIEAETTATKVTELGLNLVFRGHDGRLNVNYNSTATGTSTDSLRFGVQVQI